jgi:hypothetical protein
MLCELKFILTKTTILAVIANSIDYYMKILTFFIKIILILIWAFLIFYITKWLGFEYVPEEVSGSRSILRIITGGFILLGAYFIWKINFFKKK